MWATGRYTRQEDTERRAGQICEPFPPVCHPASWKLAGWPGYFTPNSYVGNSSMLRAWRERRNEPARVLTPLSSIPPVSEAHLPLWWAGLPVEGWALPPSGSSQTGRIIECFGCDARMDACSGKVTRRTRCAYGSVDGCDTPDATGQDL